MPTKPRAREWNKTPEAQAYRNAYTSEHYDRMTLAFPAGFKNAVDEASKAEGISRSALIVKAVKAYTKANNEGDKT